MYNVYNIYTEYTRYMVLISIPIFIIYIVYRFGIQQQLNRIEKEIETDKKTLILSQDQLENRLIKYALGFVASFGALALTAIRLFG